MREVSLALRQAGVAVAACATVLLTACGSVEWSPVAPSSSVATPTSTVLEASDALLTTQGKPIVEAAPFDTILVVRWEAECILKRGQNGLKYYAVGHGEIGETVWLEIRRSGGGKSIGQAATVHNNGNFRTRAETEDRAEYSTGTTATCVLTRPNEDLASVEVTLP